MCGGDRASFSRGVGQRRGSGLSHQFLESTAAEPCLATLTGQLFTGEGRLIHLHAIMVDPSEGFRGLHFSPAHMDRIEDHFQIASESVPWNSLIYPQWAELLLRVEAGWYGLEFRVASVTVTPRSSLLPSPSAWISRLHAYL